MIIIISIIIIIIITIIIIIICNNDDNDNNDDCDHNTFTHTTKQKEPEGLEDHPDVAQLAWHPGVCTYVYV